MQNVVRPFSKKSKLNISLDQEFKSLIQFVFIICQFEGYLKIMKLTCRPLAFTSYKAFLKNKKRSVKSHYKKVLSKKSLQKLKNLENKKRF